MKPREDDFESKETPELADYIRVFGARSCTSACASTRASDCPTCSRARSGWTKSDGVILTARLGSTTRDGARQVRAIFERAGVTITGVLAAGARRSPVYYYKRGHGYGYGYGNGYGAGHKIPQEPSSSTEKRGS